MEKYIFKVGERPEWTEELIKQLPKGTKLESAYSDEEFESDGSFFEILSGFISNNKFVKHFERNAKIISLPEWYLQETGQIERGIVIKKDESNKFEKGEKVIFKNNIFILIHEENGNAWIKSKQHKLGMLVHSWLLSKHVDPIESKVDELMKEFQRVGGDSEKIKELLTKALKEK